MCSKKVIIHDLYKFNPIFSLLEIHRVIKHLRWVPEYINQPYCDMVIFTCCHKVSK